MKIDIISLYKITEIIIALVFIVFTSDFRQEDGMVPLEAKHQALQKPKISRSLRSFIKTYNPQKALITTKEKWHVEKIENTTILFTPARYI